MNTQEKIESLAAQITALDPFADVMRPTYHKIVKCSNGQDAERITVWNDSATVANLREFFASDAFSEDDNVEIEMDSDDGSFDISAYNYCSYSDVEYIAYLESMLSHCGVRPDQEIQLPSGVTVRLTKEDEAYLRNKVWRLAK